MTKEAAATPLAGGGRTAVARRGGVVIRETGPWGRSVHSLLRHLHQVGFVGAPSVVGDGFDEQGREVLTYIDGEIINPAPWSDEAIHELGVITKQVVHGEPADRGLSGEGGVRAVHVVEVQPAGQRGGPLL